METLRTMSGIEKNSSDDDQEHRRAKA